MPDWPDLDEESIRRDEYDVTARRAVRSVVLGEQPPSDTPLQRTAARAAEHEWRRAQLRAMRSRVVGG